MKNSVLKYSFIGLLNLLILFGSCSKEDESVTPADSSNDLESVELSLAQNSLLR